MFCVYICGFMYICMEIPVFTFSRPILFESGHWPWRCSDYKLTKFKCKSSTFPFFLKLCTQQIKNRITCREIWMCRTIGQHKLYTREGNSFHWSAIPNLSKSLAAWHWLVAFFNPPSLQFHSTSSPVTLFCFIQYYFQRSPGGKLMELMAHYAFCLIGETKDSDASLFSESSYIGLFLYIKYFGWDINHPIIIIINKCQ